MDNQGFYNDIFDNELVSTANRLVIAYSGGMDSNVLLHLAVNYCQQKLNPIPIIAIHINHGINPHADDWQQHCQKQCDALGIELICHQLPLSTTGSENDLRQARYQYFVAFMQPNDVMLQGHHQQDQVETFLFRLFRGNDLGSLSSIPKQRTLGKGILYRPLLNTSKRVLNNYAKQYDLNWVEDDSNAEIYYDRNYIRHKIVDAIDQRWPNFQQQQERFQQQLSSNTKLVHTLAEIDIAQCQWRKEAIGSSIDAAEYHRLNNDKDGKDRQVNLLQYWLKHYSNSKDIGFNKAIELQKQLSVVDDPVTGIQLKSGYLHNFNQRLYSIPITPISLKDECYEVTHNIESKEPTIVVIDKWINISLVGGGYSTMVVERRRGGERCKSLQRQHSQSLKKLFQEYLTPPWLRDLMPIIKVDGKIVAVGDVFRCDEQAPTIQINFIPN